MIGTIMEVADALGSVAKAASNGTKAASDVLGVANSAATSYIEAKQALMSIAEKAKKSVMMYKVMVSSSVRESELALYIGKYLENMYGIFTLLVLGYNPMAKDNGEIGKIISGVSAESFLPDYTNKTQQEAFNRLETAIGSGVDKLGTHKIRIGKNANASEESWLSDQIASGMRNAQKQTIEEKKLQLEQDKFDYIKEKDAKADAEAEADAKNASSKISEIKFIDSVSKNNTTAYPTIINMNVSTGRDKVAIPIAIKCNLYPIGSEEMRLLIESILSSKSTNFIRKMQWKSGEISTLAWIFGTDIAEKNKKLYDKLGRNPMFVELQQRKQKAKNSFWGKFLSRFGGELGSMDLGNVSASSNDDLKSAISKANKTVAAAIDNVPPTASLIVTKEDLIAATRLNIEHFTKNEGFLNRFMKDAFLLCLGIVDLSAEQVSFFFMGYKNPFILTFDELKKESNGDKTKALYESIKELARKV